MRKIAVVTGASSGIGAATARALGDAGFHVVCAARRADRLFEVASACGGTAVVCDVDVDDDVSALAAAAGDRVDILVNCAGGAFDAAPVASADLDVWARMYSVNVLGLVRVTQALLPALRASGNALVINIGSTAGRAAYEGGGGYTAAKHGTKVITETLRLELIEEPIRFCEVAPGMVATEEFALVRFAGDQARRDAVYVDVDEPLVAEDIAEAVRWLTTLPRHVSVDEMVIRPKAQAAQHKLHRGRIWQRPPADGGVDAQARSGT